MANSPVPSRDAPVNDPATPPISPPVDLLRQLLRMMRAALIVENIADTLRATPGTLVHGEIQRMHDGVYEPLHTAVTALAAQTCPAPFQSIGKNLSAFFLSTRLPEQNALAAEISAALAERARTEDEAGTLCRNIRREFFYLKRYHRVLHDPLVNMDGPSLQ